MLVLIKYRTNSLIKSSQVPKSSWGPNVPLAAWHGNNHYSLQTEANKFNNKYLKSTSSALSCITAKT